MCFNNNTCTALAILYADLNLLDWSKSGQLAIALAGSVYLLDTSGGSNSIHHLCNMEAESIYVSSLRWNKSGKYLALGTSDSEIQVRVTLIVQRKVYVF